jgi:hypothetical protein
MLTIKMTGVICHIDPRPGDTFGKRVVLARINHGAHVHIPYVEIDKKDLANVLFDDTPDEYNRGMSRYRKFILDGDEIIVDSTDPSVPFQVIDTFKELVPSMRKVAPGVAEHPRDACFVPDSNVIAGFFDINYGMLLAGEREELPTEFNPPTQWPRQRNARSSQLLLRVKQGAVPTITLRSISTGKARRIELRNDAFGFTVGNQPPELILDESRSINITPEAHFGMFYELSPTPVEHPVLPSETSPVRNGCVPINWP